MLLLTFAVAAGVNFLVLVLFPVYIYSPDLPGMFKLSLLLAAKLLKKALPLPSFV